MKFYAISDLHLSTTVDKPMDIFGDDWANYWDIIKADWREKVTADDVVLISGDISWATKLEDAVADLNIIDELAGTKVIIKGNHDYWWNSYSKVNSVLPKGIKAIQNNAILLGGYAVAGTRLWTIGGKTEQDIKIYEREKIRLEMTLKEASKLSDKILLMTHYPPFNALFQDNEWTDLIAKYNVEQVIYGHLHSKNSRNKPIVDKRGIKYRLASCNLIDNRLLYICDGIEHKENL